jgi:hypothetical protein
MKTKLRGKITPEELEKITELYKGGMGCPTIARTLGLLCNPVEAFIKGTGLIRERKKRKKDRP